MSDDDEDSPPPQKVRRANKAATPPKAGTERNEEVMSESTVYHKAIKAMNRFSSSSDEPVDTSNETIELNLSENFPTSREVGSHKFIDDLISDY